MGAHLKTIFSGLQQEDLDGLLISLPSNVTYLTVYPSRDSYLLISKKECVYFTDSRYLEEARSYLAKNITLKEINGSVFKLIAENCLRIGLKRVGFEERHLPFAEYKKIKEELQGKAKLMPTHGLIEQLRQIKAPEEIEKIKKAIHITAQALEYIQDYLAPGRKEIEVVGELERFIRFHGASNSAFDIIVASGPNSSFPHHIPGTRKLQNNEPVLIDIGIDYQDYKSDLTRVFFLGKISSLVRTVYDIILEAQDRAIKGVRPAVQIKKIDALARQFITRKGYGKFFGHSLGHGVGLDVHEEPPISPYNQNTLKPGMLFTIEPAIYLPGKFGIRTEDMVLVTQKGCVNLSGPVNK